MKAKREWLFKLAVVSALSISGTSFFLQSEDQYSLLATSLLTPMKEIAAERSGMLADLAIEDVVLDLVSEPKEFFDFYRYEADVLLKNDGGNLKKAQVVLALEDSDEEMVLNDFDLAAGENFLIEDFEILLPGDLNFQTLRLTASITGAKEKFTANNIYETEVYGLAKKLEINVDLLKEARSEGWEIWYSENVPVRDEIYFESLEGDLVKSYGLIPMTKEIFEGNGFERISGYQNQEGFFFLREETENGDKVSDVLHLEENELLMRRDFARILVEGLNLDLAKPEVEFLSDVGLDDPDAAMIYAIYGLGILSDEEGFFRPEALVTRGEVLKAVLDYFDTEILLDEEAENRFVDIEEDSEIYPYLQVLMRSESVEGFGEEFSPDSAATNGFLKFLINEYR